MKPWYAERLWLMKESRHPEMLVEQEYFHYVIHVLQSFLQDITDQKKIIDQKVDYGIKHYNSDNPDQFTDLILQTNRQHYLDQKIKDSLRASEKPYFARIDFVPDVPMKAEEELQKLYIGKMNLIEEEKDNNTLIVDWRAPVATLYYEGRIGRGAYVCPEGEIQGEITLKRQFVVENATLQEYMDIDITTNDAFLQAALGSSKDNRLKDIVTTIQSEQNRIIRADLFRPLIVQGAAGGGKTTIALHRIAYLLYAYEKKLGAKNVMILAPSRFFLSYISGVLPELGVENVRQTTYEEFARMVLGRNIRVRSPMKALAMKIEGECGSAVGDAFQTAGLKGSLRYKELMERYYTVIMRKIVPAEDFEVEGFLLIPRREINDLFLREYNYLPAKKRLDELHKNLANRLRREKPRILASIDLKYEQLKNELKEQMPDGSLRRKKIIDLLDERDHILSTVEKKSKQLVKKYLKLFNIHSAVQYYYHIIGNRNLFTQLAEGLFTEEECALIIRHTREVYEGKMADVDDLAPLMFLHMKLFGLEDELEIKHVVIDEAQDFSLFQFDILKMITGTSSFSILGDLFQGIFSYKGVERWEDVQEQVFGNGEMATLEQSYRTTVEIMDRANEVAKEFALPGIPLAKPVIRHGKPVETVRAGSLEEAAADMERRFVECKEAGYRSMAVICKSVKDCRRMQSFFHEPPDLITGQESDYTEGAKLIPSYLVKGLEFDAVFIADVGKYRDDDLDRKLLYIAMTRALHEMVIYDIK